MNAELGANAVDGAKILDGAVANAELGANAVDGAKILDATVANADLANGAVSENKIPTGAVTSARSSTTRFWVAGSVRPPGHELGRAVGDRGRRRGRHRDPEQLDRLG